MSAEPPQRDTNVISGDTPDQMMKSRSAYTKFFDPCKEASKASMACMDKNNYDREACSEVFQEYRDCKKAWMNKLREDRRNGRV